MSEIRLAAIEDVGCIARFNQNMAMETEGRRLDDATIEAGVCAVLNDPARGFYLVASDGPKPVGCLMVTHEWSDWRNYWFWWIQSVFIEPDYRRQGIYSMMYESVLERAADRPDVGGFRLYVEKDNVRAQQTYLALGMTRCDYQMFETGSATVQADHGPIPS